jgi:hypothetical protein
MLSRQTQKTTTKQNSKTNMAYSKQFWQLTYFNDYNECYHHMNQHTMGVTMTMDNQRFIQNVQGLYENRFAGSYYNLVSGWVKVQDEIARDVIGRDGCYMKMTTERQQALFIWHCRNTGRIMVWGHKFAVINSLNKIRQRILKCSFKYIAQKEMNEVTYVIQDERDEATHPFSNLNAEMENQSIIDFNNDYVKSLRRVEFAC